MGRQFCASRIVTNPFDCGISYIMICIYSDFGLARQLGNIRCVLQVILNSDKAYRQA